MSTTYKYNGSFQTKYDRDSFQITGGTVTRVRGLNTWLNVLTFEAFLPVTHSDVPMVLNSDPTPGLCKDMFLFPKAATVLQVGNVTTEFFIRDGAHVSVRACQVEFPRVIFEDKGGTKTIQLTNKNIWQLGDDY
jgi:hypothetical protein